MSNCAYPGLRLERCGEEFEAGWLLVASSGGSPFLSPDYTTHLQKWIKLKATGDAATARGSFGKFCVPQARVSLGVEILRSPAGCN